MTPTLEEMKLGYSLLGWTEVGIFTIGLDSSQEFGYLLGCNCKAAIAAKEEAAGAAKEGGC